ncbi:MAG: DUF4406 domain-containing protein [Lachnospiraceae bacterium]|nr:DUF4406 domain-containing protein [Lachnospiraceae bacterium]
MKLFKVLYYLVYEYFKYYRFLKRRGFIRNMRESWRKLKARDDWYEYARFIHSQQTTEKKMRVYISGAITGVKNYKAIFAEAERELKSKGLDVFNPASIELGDGATWEQYMRHDLKQLLDCDAVYMLAGWKYSRGAQLEYKLAQDLHLIIYYAPEKKEAAV